MKGTTVYPAKNITAMELTVYSVETFTTSKGVEKVTVSFSTSVENEFFTTDQPYGRLVCSSTKLVPGQKLPLDKLPKHELVCKDYMSKDNKPFQVNWIKFV